MAETYTGMTRIISYRKQSLKKWSYNGKIHTGTEPEVRSELFKQAYYINLDQAAVALIHHQDRDHSMLFVERFAYASLQEMHKYEMVILEFWTKAKFNCASAAKSFMFSQPSRVTIQPLTSEERREELSKSEIICVWEIKPILAALLIQEATNQAANSRERPRFDVAKFNCTTWVKAMLSMIGIDDGFLDKSGDLRHLGFDNACSTKDALKKEVKSYTI